jgi:hypothetical protein
MEVIDLNMFAFPLHSMDFAPGQLPPPWHAALVKTHWGDKLIGHVSRDATAMEGAEQPQPKTPSAETPAVPKRKPGRPRKGALPLN